MAAVAAMPWIDREKSTLPPRRRSPVVEIAVDAAESHLLLGFGEVDAEDALGRIQTKAVDPRGRGAILPGQHRSGGTGCDKGRKNRRLFIGC